MPEAKAALRALLKGNRRFHDIGLFAAQLGKNHIEPSAAMCGRLFWLEQLDSIIQRYLNSRRAPKFFCFILLVHQQHAILGVSEGNQPAEKTVELRVIIFINTPPQAPPN